MLFDLLTERARAHPDKVAVVGERNSLTYFELHRQAGRLALYLESQGLKSGEPILLGVPPSPDFFVAFYGACALGLLALPVLPTGLIAPVYQSSNAAGAIGTADFLAEIKARCPGIRTALPWSSSSGLAIPNLPGEFVRSRVFREESVLGVSSSGTTGEPKLYLRSSELIHFRAKLRAEVQQIVSSDVFLSTRPFNSGSAINNHVVLPILVGGKVIAHERFERFKAADAISQERVTVLYGVPFIFELLSSIPGSRPVDFSSLRLCISGSAPLPQFVAKQFYDRFGISIRQRYSGSHFYPAFSYNINGPIESVGRIDGVFPMAILAADGKPAAAEQIGEIAFSITHLTPYLRRIAELNPNRTGDFILTGDLGKLDTDGNVYVVGRKSPFIKVGGIRVEPAEVEGVLRSHPAVKEAIVYAIRPGEADEAVGAMVAAGSVSEQELLRYCAERLDLYKCPHQISLRDELPRTEHGKVSRQLFESLPLLALTLGGAYYCLSICP